MTHDRDDGLDKDDEDLSAAMIKRLKRATADEKASLPDLLVDDPNVDLDMYRRVMRLRVANHVISRHRIYLDMNYWIWLRDAAFRKPALAVHTDLWGLLRELNSTGRVICPVSNAVYSEVMKQSDASRQRTACVVDRLCESVCIVDQVSRIRMQLSHFVWTKLLGDTTLPPADQFVWAPVSHILGMGHFELRDWPAEANLKQQKLWLRFTQSLRFSDLIEHLRGRPPEEPEAWRSTLLQNLMSKLTRDNLRSLKATYKIEVSNCTDLIAKDIADFAVDLFAKHIRTPLGPETSPADLAASLASIITAGLKMGRITTDFPQYHIMGVLHASIRWMRRRHQVNDLDDHQHATAAIPYCNAFFTERSMRDLLARPPFCLDRTYGCRVISDPGEALAYLEELASKAC